LQINDWHLPWSYIDSVIGRNRNVRRICSLSRECLWSSGNRPRQDNNLGLPDTRLLVGSQRKADILEVVPEEVQQNDN
jgi:hypothetical protein